MYDRRCFVHQFLHPGGEHQPDHDGCKHWNVNDHKRKFMTSRGRYRCGADGQDQVGELVFWGEWEPESRVVTEISNPLRHGPRFVYEPYYIGPSSNGRGQNTDPFVFGDQFHYTGCLQHRVTGPTQLRYLTRGSVILFGSCVESRFVIDTVLVVDTYIDHGEQDYRQALDGRISATYRNATVEPWYKAAIPDGQSHRLYFGATPDRPVHGMFSFFPCLPAGQTSPGFERPEIHIPGLTSPRKNQGYSLKPDLGLDQLKTRWDQVVAQVKKQGRALGVYAELPPRQDEACSRAAGSVGAGSCSPNRRTRQARKC